MAARERETLLRGVDDCIRSGMIFTEATPIDIPENELSKRTKENLQGRSPLSEATSTAGEHHRDPGGALDQV